MVFDSIESLKARTESSMEREKIKMLIKGLLGAIGEDSDRDGLRETPERVAKSFEKLFEGYTKDPREVVKVFDGDGYSEMIIAGDIDFCSVCEHHMLPFYGMAFIGYVPRDKIIGISKLPRLIELYSRRLQNQERLTRQIAEAIQTTLNPKGVGVVLKAEHFCMKLRGVEKQNCKISTLAFAGSFTDDIRMRDEFLRSIEKRSTPV